MRRRPPSRLARLSRRIGLLAGLLLTARGASAQSDAWVVRGPFGGSVHCIAPDPQHPATLYAGTDDGVFRSDDGGATWRPSRAGLPFARVQALAVEPSAPGTLYAGTVTPNGVASVGIFKSTDGGESWNAINSGLADPLTAISPLDVEVLAVDPAHPGTVLAGTRFSEIFQSTDGGANWTPATFGGFAAGLEVSAFVFDPVNPGIVLAASTSGLLRSVDGGASWGGFGDAGITLFALAADPTAPAVLYAGNVTGFGVLRSTDSGVHWTQINANLPAASGSSGTAWPLVLSIAVDPSNPSSLTIGTFGDGAFTSADGGASWAPASDGLRSPFVGALHYVPSPQPALLAGALGAGVFRRAGTGAWTPSSAGILRSLVTSLAEDAAAPGTIYAGSFDGVHRSGDGGATWQLAADDLPLFPVSSVAASPDGGGRIFAATLGGGLFLSADRGATWNAAGQGLTDVFVDWVAVDPSNPSVLFAATGNPSGNPGNAGVFRSADGGATWARTSLAPGGNTLSIDFLTVNPSNPSEVVAVSRGESVYFHSGDSGATWTPVTPAAACGNVRTAAFAGSAIVIGGSSGACRSADGGGTWNASSPGAATSVEVLAADPSNPGVLYAGAAPAAVGGTGGVFRSADGGSSWTSVGSGLEATAVTSLLLDASGALHAGLDGGSVAELPRVPPETPGRQPVAPPLPGTRPTRDIGPR